MWVVLNGFILHFNCIVEDDAEELPTVDVQIEPRPEENRQGSWNCKIQIYFVLINFNMIGSWFAGRDDSAADVQSGQSGDPQGEILNVRMIFIQMQLPTGWLNVDYILAHIFFSGDRMAANTTPITLG